MENSYGVGVVNRYALFLDDESDPLDLIKAKEAAKERKKKTKEAEKENKGKPEIKAKVAPVAPARKGIKETQNVKPQDGKVTGEPKRENKPPVRSVERNNERPPPRRREDRPNGPGGESGEGAPRPPRREFGDKKPERRSYGDNPGGERRNYVDGEGGERRGPPRERGPRGGGSGRGFDGRGKREFDRRSGSDRTGVKPVDKREGGGSHNWGTHKDDLDEWNKTQSEGEQTDGEQPKIESSPAAASAAPAEPTPTDEETPAAPVEEEPKELTLDEWKALRSTRQKPQYNLRKAGEGEDLSQWKDMVVLKKDKPEGEDSDDEYDSAEYPQRVGRQKRVIGIEFTFSEQRRGGPGRGGRGRGRGGGGRGGERGGRRRDEGAEAGGAHHEERPVRGPRQSAPKVDDNKDFPSLG